MEGVRALSGWLALVSIPKATWAVEISFGKYGAVVLVTRVIVPISTGLVVSEHSHFPAVRSFHVNCVTFCGKASTSCHAFVHRKISMNSEGAIIDVVNPRICPAVDHVSSPNNETANRHVHPPFYKVITVYMCDWRPTFIYLLGLADK
jgi:hypothetical protein